MAKIRFENRIKTVEEQVEDLIREIQKQDWIMNREWAIEQIKENPNVEFEFYNVHDFITEYIDPNNKYDPWDLRYGEYGWLRIKGTPKPEFIIH